MQADSHFIFDLISSAVTVAWVVIGLLIKSSLGAIHLAQAKDKAELLFHQNVVKDDLNEKHVELMEGQSRLRADFDQKHGENKQGLAVHIAEDLKQFNGIDRTLNRIENKMDSRAQVIDDKLENINQKISDIS